MTEHTLHRHPVAVALAPKHPGMVYLLCGGEELKVGNSLCGEELKQLTWSEALELGAKLTCIASYSAGLADVTPATLNARSQAAWAHAETSLAKVHTAIQSLDS